MAPKSKPRSKSSSKPSFRKLLQARLTDLLQQPNITNYDLIEAANKASIDYLVPNRHMRAALHKLRELHPHGVVQGEHVGPARPRPQPHGSHLRM